MLIRRHLNDPDTNRPATGLIHNVPVLVAAGHAAAAHALLLLLLCSDPAWRLSRHGPAAGMLRGMLPMVSVLAGAPGAAWGDQPAMAAEALGDWAC